MKSVRSFRAFAPKCAATFCLILVSAFNAQAADTPQKKKTQSPEAAQPAADPLKTPDAPAADTRTALDTIEVTASPFSGRTADELVVPVTVISGAELDRKRATTIGDVLANEPGISTSGFGPGAGRPVIRGQYGPRVQVLQNGIGALDLSDISPDHAVSIDTADASQIEVIRGPATLLYGNGASGGVVNIVNENLSDDPETGLLFSGDGSYSGNGRLGNGSAEIHYGNGLFKTHLTGGHRASGDFDIPGFAGVGQTGSRGFLANSATAQDNGSVSLAYTGDDNSVGVAFSALDSQYGLPNEAEALIKQNQNRFDLRATARNPVAGVEAMRVQLGYNHYTHTEFEDPVTPGTVFHNNEVQTRVELTHAKLGPLNGAFGVQIDSRDFSATGGEALVPQTQTTSVGVFGVEDWKLPLGTLEFGLRVEPTDHGTAVSSAGNPLKGNSPSRDFTPVSAALGYLLPIADDYHARINFSHAERAPRPEELYSFGAHGATGAFERGDANLKPETSNGVELSLDKHVGRFTGTATVYYTAFQNYVFEQAVDCNQNAGTAGCTPDGNADRVDADGTFNPAGEFQLFDFAQASAQFYGFELQSGLSLIERGPFTLGARAFSDFVQGRLDQGGALPRINPTRVGLGFDAAYLDLTASLDYTRVEAQERTAALETRTAGYNLLNLDLAYGFALGAKSKATIYLRGRNLADDEIRYHTSFIKDVVTAPGRAVFTGVRLEFGG